MEKLSHIKESSSLLPLHQMLIKNFPRLEEVLIEKLLSDKKIQETRLEIKKIIQNILSSSDENNNNVYNEYTSKITYLIRELCNDNSLFYDDLPNNWESYLLDSLDEILLSMKNKQYLSKMFFLAIESIKKWEKVKFTKILESLTDNASWKYELNKILTLLKESYWIDFIKIGWWGCVLKIHSVKKIENILSQYYPDIEKIIDYNKDPSWIILNQILDVFKLFIKNVLLHRKINKFTQDEFVKFVIERLPFLTISTVRNFTKELYNRFQHQWITLEKLSWSNISKFHFNLQTYNIFVEKYFPDLEKHPEILIQIQKLLEKLELWEKETISIFIQDFVEKTYQKRFFNIKEFLIERSLPDGLKQKINTILSLLAKHWMVWRYWKDKYFLQLYSQKNDNIYLSQKLREFEILLEKEQEKNRKLEQENRNLEKKLRELQIEKELLLKDYHDLQVTTDWAQKDEIISLKIQLNEWKEKDLQLLKWIQSWEISLIKASTLSFSKEQEWIKKTTKKVPRRQVQIEEEDKKKIQNTPFTIITDESFLKWFNIQGRMTPRYFKIIKKLFSQIEEILDFSINPEDVKRIFFSQERIQIIFIWERVKKWENQISFLSNDLEESLKIDIDIIYD